MNCLSFGAEPGSAVSDAVLPARWRAFDVRQPREIQSPKNIIGATRKPSVYVRRGCKRSNSSVSFDASPYVDGRWVFNGYELSTIVALLIERFDWRSVTPSCQCSQYERTHASDKETNRQITTDPS
jgi:hypothetical protein